jgi:hypothetical protein
MRVKLVKVVMRMPTRPDSLEGSMGREETRAGARNSPTNEHLIRVQRGMEHGVQNQIQQSHFVLDDRLIGVH